MRPTVNEIIEITAECHGITAEDITGHSRERRYSWPRQIAMHIAREMTDHSYPGLAYLFGDRDHTTVCYAIKAVDARMRHSRDYQAERDRVVREIRERITGPEFKTRRATGPAFTTTRKETA